MDINLGPVEKCYNQQLAFLKKPSKKRKEKKTFSKPVRN
jgi:hypothetical protein